MRLRPEQLGTHLARHLAPIYLVYGDEPLLIQEAADTIRAAVRQQGDCERLCLTAGSGFDWNALLQALDSPSLFVERRLLELRLEGTRLDEAGSKALNAYAKRPAEDAILLIIGGRLEAAAQKGRWFNALDQAGVVVRTWPIDARRLPGWIERRMQTAGLQPAAGAAALLAERVEGNLLAAAQEIEKLQVLFGSQQAITCEQLLNVVSDSARYSVYDLIESALEADAGRVVRILNGLRSEGVEPVLVSWALHREIRQLASLSFDLAQGLSVESALARQQIWERRKPLLRRALQRLPVNVCRQLLKGCARLDRLVKGAEKGRIWDELLGLSLRLAGLQVAVNMDDDTFGYLKEYMTIEG